jgi:hypothetical protein
MLCLLRVRLTPPNSITTTTAANNAENANLPVLEPIKNIPRTSEVIGIYQMSQSFQLQRQISITFRRL